MKVNDVDFHRRLSSLHFINNLLYCAIQSVFVCVGGRSVEKRGTGIVATVAPLKCTDFGLVLECGVCNLDDNVQSVLCLDELLNAGIAKGDIVSAK